MLSHLARLATLDIESDTRKTVVRIGETLSMDQKYLKMFVIVILH